MEIIKTIKREYRKWQINKEICKLMDKRNYLISMGFPVTFSYGSPIDDKIKDLQQEEINLVS